MNILVSNIPSDKVKKKDFEALKKHPNFECETFFYLVSEHITMAKQEEEEEDE